MQAKKLTLSSADILALDMTPIPLVLAPGAGNLLLPISLFARLNFGTIAYVGGSQINLSFGPIANGNVFAALPAAFLLNAASRVAVFPLAALLYLNDASANLLNQAISIYATGAAFTAGDGTLDFYLAYDPLRL